MLNRVIGYFLTSLKLRILIDTAQKNFIISGDFFRGGEKVCMHSVGDTARKLLIPQKFSKHNDMYLLIIYSTKYG